MVKAYDEKIESSLYYYDGTNPPRQMEVKLEQYSAKSGKEVSVEVESDENTWQIENKISDMQMGAGGELLAADYNDNLMEIDKATGECLHSFVEEGNFYYFQVLGNMLLTVGENGLEFYDIGKKSIQETDQVLNQTLGEQAEKDWETDGGSYSLIGTAGLEEHQWIFCNHQGLYSFSTGGSTVEQLINGQLNSLNDPSRSLKGVWCLSQEEYMVAMENETTMESYLCRYVYDKDVLTVPDKELKIFALENPGELRQAIALYQKAYPDVYVNLETALSGEDGVTAEDAIRAQNISQMAGKGADILLLDGLPVESYVEKGMLMDIQDVVEEIGDTDGVFENIRQAYEQDGKLYAFPGRFFLPVMMGDISGFQEKTEITALGEYAAREKAADTDDVIFSWDGADTILEELYHGYSSHWQKENQLDEDQLKKYLQAAKQIYDTRPSTEEESSMSFALEGSMQSAITGTISFQSLSCIIENAKAAGGLMGSLSDYMTMLAVLDKTGGEYVPMGQGESFVPYLLTGISSRTKMEKEAKDFLRILLGKEAGASLSSGIPTNRAALSDMINTVFDGEYAGGIALMNSDGTMTTLDYQRCSQEELDAFYTMAEAAKKPELSSRVIKELVLENGEKYLAGTMTLEEASAAILQKANLYFSE